MFKREKLQNERIELLERRVFLLEAALEQLRAKEVPTAKAKAPRKKA